MLDQVRSESCDLIVYQLDFNRQARVRRILGGTTQILRSFNRISFFLIGERHHYNPRQFFVCDEHLLRPPSVSLKFDIHTPDIKYVVVVGGLLCRGELILSSRNEIP